MEHISIVVEREQALREFQRPWREKLRRLLWGPARPAPFAAHQLPFCELIWMPSYLVTIATRSTRGESTVTCSIDGCSGSFALFELQDAIEEGTVGESFAPTLSATEAEDLARRGLLQVILRRRSRRGKTAPEGTRCVQLLRYPYWVYYYRRGRNLVDIKVLDAATGLRTGPKLKTGILEAFRRAAGNPNPDYS